MSLGIAGMGWVTPLGTDINLVWESLLNGKTASAQTISSPLGPDYPIFSVPRETTARAQTQPRMRRSSAISRFAVMAGLAALEEAEMELDPVSASRTALIFAVSNGGVIYTRRFYDEIVDSGAQTASPLLFPETVFNAPASHLAAILGITGATYTLVGDGAVGILALKMAEDLMANESLDRCLVVAAEEADWLLCDAYRKWRLLRSKPPLEPFGRPARGTILSEGAGAILLTRDHTVRVDKIAAGTNFRRQVEARLSVQKIFEELCDTTIDLVFPSANGTFIDDAEHAAILKNCPEAGVYAIKGALGEGVGAGGLWQVICGVQSLRSQVMPENLRFPPNQKARNGVRGTNRGVRCVIVPVCGLNQQVAGARLAMS